MSPVQYRLLTRLTRIKADRTESYTRIAPFQERNDTSVECVNFHPFVPRYQNPFRFFYKPITLTALSVGLAALAYVAMSSDVLAEGQDKRRVYAFSIYSSRVSLITFVISFISEEYMPQ